MIVAAVETAGLARAVARGIAGVGTGATELRVATLIVIAATHPASPSARAAQMSSVAPAQASCTLGYRRTVVLSLDGIAEGAVEVDGVGCYALEGARRGIVDEFHKEHARGGVLWEEKVRCT